MRLNTGGFSLAEMMISLSISSLLLLFTSTLLVNLQQGLFSVYQHYRLEEIMLQATSSIEKSLRRAGFIATLQGDEPAINPVIVDHSRQQITVCYDIDKRGRYELTNNAFSSIVRYRVKNSTLEYRRGSDEEIARWEKISDPNELTITDYRLEFTPYAYQLTFSATLTQHPLISKTIRRFIRRENG